MNAEWRVEVESVAVALAELDAQRDVLLARMCVEPDAATWALDASRLAVVYARQAGWWRILLRRTPPEVPVLYRKAVIRTAVERRDKAREWRGLAAQSRQRAAALGHVGVEDGDR